MYGKFPRAADLREDSGSKPPSEYVENSRYTQQSLNRAFLRKACHSDCKAVLSGKDNEGYTPSVNRQRYGKKDDKSILTYPRGREHFVICLLYCYGMVRYRAAPRERNTEMTVIYEK